MCIALSGFVYGVSEDGVYHVSEVLHISRWMQSNVDKSVFFLVVPRKKWTLCACAGWRNIETGCVNMIFTTCICIPAYIKIVQYLPTENFPAVWLGGPLAQIHVWVPSPLSPPHYPHPTTTFSPLPHSLQPCSLPPGKAVLNGNFGADSNLTITNSSSSEKMKIAAGKCDSGL